MEVLCPNAPHALECQWKGELSDVEEHRLECQREFISCPYSKIGCQEEMYRSDVKAHKEKHKETHLDLSMEMVLSLTLAVEELQEQLAQQKSVIDNLTEEIKRSKMS